MSTQPAITAMSDGYALSWIDDRQMPASVYVQRLDATASPVSAPRRLDAGALPYRPRVASSGDDIALITLDLSTDPPTTHFVLLDEDLEQTLASFTLPGEGPHDAAHAPGLTFHHGRYLVGFAREGAFNVVDVQVTDASETPGAEPPPVADTDAGADAGRSGDAGSGPRLPSNVRVGRRTIPLGEEISDAGLVELFVLDDRLLFAADHPEGWSIVVAEVGDQQVSRFSQVLDDRRNPEHRWCCPALGRTREGHLAIMWQGPGLGIAQLYFLELDPEGHPIGTERPFEGVVRDDEERPIGRAPVFWPAMAQTPSGLIAAFADNRFANTEVLLASFTCGGQR